MTGSLRREDAAAAAAVEWVAAQRSWIGYRVIHPHCRPTLHLDHRRLRAAGFKWAPPARKTGPSYFEELPATFLPARILLPTAVIGAASLASLDDAGLGGGQTYLARLVCKRGQVIIKCIRAVRRPLAAPDDRRLLARSACYILLATKYRLTFALHTGPAQPR